jgi:16S rRNA (cytosine1402-N4)-methyltransferase
MPDFHHLTVLRDEATDVLAPAPGKVFLDCTLGGGGHTEALLARGARVYGIDRDPVARAAATARLAAHGDRFTALSGNFADARKLLDDVGVGEIDGVLADLGVSSPQLDVAERGFSFMKAGPLDMRMGPDAEPLDALLARVSENELSQIIHALGDEPFAPKIAKAIKAAVAAGTVKDTLQLAELIGQAIPRGAWPKRISPATRTFQALRMAVNRELESLDALLAAMPTLVKVGGRVAFITFHSLEDRRVKDAFRALEGRCTCPPGLPVCVCGAQGSFRVLKRKATVAGDAELTDNPRARSAQLRAVERVR